MSFTEYCDILQQVAENNGVSEEEVQEEIQIMIDDLWSDPEKDTPAFRLMREEFGRKPTVSEMIGYLAECIMPENRH